MKQRLLGLASWPPMPRWRSARPICRSAIRRCRASRGLKDLISGLMIEEKASQLVKQARDIPRLGIPDQEWGSEALHGVANNGYAIVFAEPVGLVGAFGPLAIQEMGHTIGIEGRAKSNQFESAWSIHKIMQGMTLWLPNIYIFRDPRWGKGQETYSEDPFLTAGMRSRSVRGVQGDNPKY